MKVTHFYDELRDLFWKSRAPEELRRFKATRVRDTGRTDPNPPETTPYDFAINEEWYDKNKDKEIYQITFRDYYMYSDPNGFGVFRRREETE